MWEQDLNSMWLYLSIPSGQKETVIVPGSVLIIHCWLLAGLCLNAKWKRVSTVTVTNAYASSTTAILNDPHTSSKSQHTHIPGSTLRLSKLCSMFSLCLTVSLSNMGRGSDSLFFFLTVSVHLFRLHPLLPSNEGHN